MRISTKGQYALEAMLVLALAGEFDNTSIRQIGEQTQLSDSYLEQIFSLLRKAGLVVSIRGNQGGYRLANKASEIKTGDVLRAAEGSLAPVRCTDQNLDCCTNQEICPTRPVWRLLEETILKTVDHLTLADLAQSFVRGDYHGRQDYSI